MGEEEEQEEQRQRRQGEAERRSEEAREVRRSGCSEVVGGPPSARGQSKGASWAAGQTWPGTTRGEDNQGKGPEGTSRRMKTS